MKLVFQLKKSDVFKCMVYYITPFLILREEFQIEITEKIKLAAGQFANSKTMIIEKTLNITDKKLFVLKIYGF